ncbi:GNAT family N-acetyltransferase [Streptacidiphilus sp. PB12-B1b]|uniref:GNAT family N-acetyltransferase n=1 Tax=Streptacidiphilus sp. PB12-B1b TaxID=2705012 RepID=UPI0015FC3791|nr:GNAT family N-acetyltransferase [Streptacidiphilus sp. PB12-B1b]QMU74443.1 GNAT family N-acetyltransferase [Streptacidiphilus sp. PB12-B1b]
MTAGRARTLRSERLELRPVGYAAATDLSTGGDGGFAWAPGGPGEGTRDAATLVALAVLSGDFDPAWGSYVIVRRQDGTAVGGIGFHGPPDDGSAEIGYDLADSARGRGYATEAARTLCRHVLNRPGIDLVVAHTEPGNTASQAVVARAGFVRDGEGGDGLYRFTLRRPGPQR